MLRGGKRTGVNRTLGLLSLFQTGCQIEVQDIFSVLNDSHFFWPDKVVCGGSGVSMFLHRLI